jgi:hypothetical protein
MFYQTEPFYRLITRRSRKLFYTYECIEQTLRCHSGCLKICDQYRSIFLLFLTRCSCTFVLDIWSLEWQDYAALQ